MTSEFLKSEIKTQLQSATMTEKFLSFQIHGTKFAIEITKVRAVNKPFPFTQVSSKSQLLLGVMNMRGEPLQIVSLEKLLGLPNPENTQDPTNRILVVLSAESFHLGVFIDNMPEIITVKTEKIKPLDDGNQKYSHRIHLENQEPYFVIDTALLFYPPENPNRNMNKEEKNHDFIF